MKVASTFVDWNQLLVKINRNEIKISVSVSV